MVTHSPVFRVALEIMDMDMTPVSDFHFIRVRNQAVIFSGDFSKTAREDQLPLKFKKLNGQIYTVVFTKNVL